MISDKEKKKRQHTKELISIRNRMGNNLIWFDSLTIERQFNFLFQWKKEKHNNKLIEPKVSYRLYRGISTKYIKYPPNLKHFTERLKYKNGFRVNRISTRNSFIDLILK
jgi:hypothetical protein